MLGLSNKMKRFTSRDTAGQMSELKQINKHIFALGHDFIIKIDVG
jgi:hypothetical protein